MGASYTRQSTYTTGDTIQAADTNDEFDQLLAAFNATSGHSHDGTTGEGGPITGLISNTLTFGAGSAGTDITITFDGETNDGIMKWMEDEDYFEFPDDILMSSTEKLQFRDTAIYLNSSTDGQLDIVADTLVQIASAAFTVDASGDITLDAGGADVILKDDGTQYASFTNSSGDLVIKSGSTTAMTFSGANVTFAGTVTIGSAGISEAELEILDGATVTTTELNIMDGDTSASSTTVVDADRVVFNDDGTMKQVAVTDLAAYFDDEITAMPNLTSVGTLTTLTVDNVIINGTTIGHTSDTDLITVADGLVTIAGEISATTLDIGGTNVTATAAELNILDGVTATTAELNIMDGVTATAAELNIMDGVTATATELNIMDGNTSATSTTVADADRVVLNDNGTMAQVAVTDLAAYFDDEITAMPNLVSTGALDSGSITSGFGTINTGSSTITTTGLITGGSLDIDDVVINGSTIGHTDDTDLITVANGVVTVAGEISVTTLDIGGTNVTSTAAELNIIDGGTSATSTTLADADRVVVNDNGTMVQVALTDFETYFESALDTLSNVTTVGDLDSGSITSGFGNIDVGSSNLTATGTISLGATSFNDNAITNVGDIALDSISADGTDINVAISDNSATAFTIKQGSDAYLIIDTANSSESVSIGTGISGTAITIGHGTSETTVADNLTVSGDATVTGSLTVNGTTTTIATTNLTVSDHLIKLGQGYTGSANDQGVIITRGDGSSSNTANKGFIWDESADEFATVAANTEAGTTTGNVTINDYANLHVGGLTADDTITFGSLVGSAGGATITGVLDEDNFTSDSDTKLATQQSIKAFVDSAISGSGSMSNFILEDDDGTEVSVTNAKELKFIGSGITTNFTDTSTGSDADPFDLTFTVDAAQTGITSVTNASLVVGRDADNQIKFGTDNEITFRVSAGDGVVFKASGEIEATSLDISGDADINGTLEADAITVDGTALATVIAGTTVTNATNAAHVTVADNENTNENNLIPFIEDTSATGNVGLESDGDFTYNPSTGRLTATQLAGTLTTAAQTNVTSLGTLTTLTVDDITINGSTISDGGDFTLDVDGNIEINANGGTITFKDDAASLGTITSSGYSGNAGTATALETARTINGTSFDGTGNIVLGNGSVTHVMLAGDAVDGDNIADDSINSEHYVDASIDHAHLANDCVDGDNIADDSINSEHYVNASIDHAHLANDCVDGDNIADDSINSEHYVNASIDHAHLANDCVDGDNIQDNAINSEHYTDGSIDTAHIADDQVTYAKIQNVSATNRILGRDSSGAGVIEEISPSSLRTMINVADGATANSAGNAITISSGAINHSDTSSQASVDNSGSTFIQDITLDTYGHVTAIGSATVSATGTSDAVVISTGTRNTGGGTNVFDEATSGMSDCTVFGFHALKQADNDNVDNITAVGSYALEKLDTFIGGSAGYGKHTAIGAKALRHVGLASNHVAVGFQAMMGRNSSGDLDNAINGNACTVVGNYSLRAQLSGAYNSVFGFNASNFSFDNVTGNYNTSLGYGAKMSARTSSYQFTLGNGDTNNLRCADTSISSLSDRRDKTEIIDSPYGLEFIKSVRPVQFKWNKRKLTEHENKPGRVDPLKDKVRVGFIAQELQAAQNAVSNTTKDILNLVQEDDPRRLEAKQGNLLPIIVKAVQELSAKVDELTTRVTALE